MSSQSFYMIRLQGGEFDPRRKIRTLARAMEIAFEMASIHGRRATVIQTVASVEVVDGKPVWTDRNPGLDVRG
jgi:hypothetical protein